MPLPTHQIQRCKNLMLESSLQSSAVKLLSNRIFVHQTRQSSFLKISMPKNSRINVRRSSLIYKNETHFWPVSVIWFLRSITEESAAITRLISTDVIQMKYHQKRLHYPVASHELAWASFHRNHPTKVGYWHGIRANFNSLINNPGGLKSQKLIGSSVSRWGHVLLTELHELSKNFTSIYAEQKNPTSFIALVFFLPNWSKK